MFDRTSIVNQLCRQWIQQGRLTERAWLQVKEQHRESKADLEVLLLASPHVDEDMLLEGLASAIGCRFWKGNALVRSYARKPPPALPLALDFFAHKQILPISWEPGTGTLHLIMPRLPPSSLLNELKALLPIRKLHLELATNGSLHELLGIWLKRSSKITTVIAAGDPVALGSLLEEETPSSQETQAIGSLADAMAEFDPTYDPATAHTHNAPAFDEKLQENSALGQMGRRDDKDKIDQTYAIVPLAPPPEQRTQRRPPQQTPTIEAAPPKAYPSQQNQTFVNPATSPQSAMALSDGIAPSGQLPSGDLTLAQKKSRLPSGDLTLQNEAINPSFTIDDGEFFLDYQNPQTPAPESIDFDDDPPLPTAQGDEPLDVVLERTSPGPPPVLDLFEEVEEVPAPQAAPAPTPPPAKPAPAPATPAPEAPALQPGSPILPSDDELFGHSLGSRPAPSRPAPISRTSHIKPAPPPSSTAPSRRANQAKPKGKKNVEGFLLRYVLGSAVGVFNLALRGAFLAIIGYLIWYLFLSQ